MVVIRSEDLKAKKIQVILCVLHFRENFNFHIGLFFYQNWVINMNVRKRI